MNTPTTQWDMPPTDKELNGYYGKDKSTKVRVEMIETITQTLRKVSSMNIGLQYVKYESNGSARIAIYPLCEVVTDYGADPKPLAALMAVLEKSDCPLVQAYRVALAERYADAWADDVEEFAA